MNEKCESYWNANPTRPSIQNPNTNRTSPIIGESDKITRLSEYKVEMVCDDQLIKQVVTTLLQVHPYQEPAYEVYRVFSLGELMWW